MLTVSELRSVGCVVSSDAPVVVTEGQVFTVYRMVDGSEDDLATGVVRMVWDSQTFKLNPQDGQSFDGVLVGDLVK